MAIGVSERGRNPQITSPFRRAIDAYVRSRPKKSSTPEFLAALQNSGWTTTEEDVQRAMIELEKNNANNTATRLVRKTLKPVMSVLSTYTDVVDSLSQADPMPTAIVWGIVKAVVQTSNRFLDLYEKISKQLEAMKTHLTRLTEYDDLFGESVAMQEILEASYIDVIRFWCRVEKECKRCAANRMGRALASFSNAKLDAIIASMREDADQIDKLVPIVQERLQRREREDQAEERRLAGLARSKESAFFKEHLEEIKIRNLERRRQRLKSFRDWLKADSSHILESDFRNHERNTRIRSPDTCTWLSQNSVFHKWLTCDPTVAKLWLRASPGMGKSVLCGYAIQEIERFCPTSCWIFHYYSFDEDFSTIQIYRSLAEQLSNHLWGNIEDLPEEIHAVTQRTANSINIENIKEVIKLLVKTLPTIYIFLDGLDEECDNGQRCSQMQELVAFLTDLVDESPETLRLWSSSQDRTSLRPRMERFRIIEVSKEVNRGGIKQYLVDKIQTFDHLDIDPGYRTLLSEDICQKSEGCFLLASFMLDSISRAPTLQAIQEITNKSLPHGYEIYYQRKLNDLEISQKPFVSALLACLVYAKRPLRLEELCEAMAVQHTPHGQNIDKSQKIFKNQVLKLCEPLIEIHESDNRTICTLSHSSVRKFLDDYFKKQQVLGTPSKNISDPLADICLRYLSQRCYRRLLVKNGNNFEDADGADITEHHLLSYAAKYWDKHMDGIPYSSVLCERVKRFLVSSHFQTCLQVQSLFVEGQFQVWFSSRSLWQGPQRRRVFPSWLFEDCGPAMEQDYQFFVAEWGNVMNTTTTIHGQYPGQIDRCFWSALGPRNFLRSGQSRYRNFMLDPDIQEDGQIPIRYFEGLDDAGNQVLAVTLVAMNNDLSHLQFRCDEWTLRGRSPKHVRSQSLNVLRSSWWLYDQPKKLLGRPAPVSFSTDLRFLRIGNRIFNKSQDETFVPIEGMVGEDGYFEEIMSRGHFVALSTRQRLTEADMSDDQTDANGLNTDEVFDHSEKLAQILEESVKSASSDANARGAASTQETTNTQASSLSMSSSHTSASSLVIEDSDLVEPQGQEKRLKDLASNSIDDDMSSVIESNSAEESWSEGSAESDSDVLDDEEQWNDWRNGDLADMKELEADIVERDGDSQNHGNETDVDDISHVASDLSEDTDELGDFDVSLPMGYRVRKRRSSSSDSSTSSIRSTYSQSIAVDSDDPDADESDLENEDGRRLEDLMFGNGRAYKRQGAKRASLMVYDLKDGQQKLIFHYSELLSGRLYQSPPEFHPTQPLLVWPLGDNEVLFANLNRNTYFTRRLCCSQPKSSQFFVKSRFSVNGEFLHFAALEVTKTETESGEGAEKKASLLRLNLQISTHRLSLSKTARVPPRLIFRTNVPLGATSSLPVSRLPYTLTWTSDHLYLCGNSEVLAVTRIPLFRSEYGKTNPVCYTQGEVFLPRSVESRNVFYFPPPSSNPDPKDAKGPRIDKRQRQRQKRKNGKATIIIGSYASIPSQGYYVPKSLMSPPIGLYLDEEEDLGGWKFKINADTGSQKVNVDGGKLKGKFESFDLNEDCDIVPYLF